MPPNIKKLHALVFSTEAKQFTPPIQGSTIFTGAMNAVQDELAFHSEEPPALAQVQTNLGRGKGHHPLKDIDGTHH